MLKLIFALGFALAISSPASAGEPSRSNEALCKVNTPYGAPVPEKTRTVRVCREAYALDFDTGAKIPTWVSYVLTQKHAVGCFPRVSSFRIDTDVPQGTSATQKDYAKSGYDIGHMANSADLRWSAQTEIDSEVFSNAAPQTPNLNRGEWKALEDQVRAWALSRKTSILIYVGPIYSKTAPSVMNGTSVVIPTAFYKVLVDTKTNEVLSFIYPNNEQVSGALEDFVTSFQEVQNWANVVFKLPKNPIFSQVLWSVGKKNARAAKADVCSLK